MTSGAQGQPVRTKEVFLLRLIGICAGVDQRLEKAGKNPDPGQVAAELEGFIAHAVTGEIPTQDRQKFDTMVSSLSDAAGKFRAAAEAKTSGDASSVEQASAAAKQAYDIADHAAVGYGMPHLSDCAKQMQGGSGADVSVAWRTLGNAPAAVQQVGTAVMDGVIWVVGGLSAGQASSKTMGYDPVLDSWAFGPDLPMPLHHVMAVSYQGDLVVVGGFVTNNGQLTTTASNKAFRLRDQHWEELPPLHHARAAGAAAVIGTKLVVVGGRDGQLLVSPTEVFDGTRWQDGAPIPVPGDHLAAVTDGSALYAVGGRNLTSDKNTAALQRYDPNLNRWTRLPDMPTARGGLGAALVNGTIIAVGGEAPTSVYGTVESYNLAAGSWSTALPEVKTPRHGLAVAAVGNQLYAIDGARKPGHQDSTNVVEELDLSPSSTSASAEPAQTAPSQPASAAAAIYQCPQADQSALRVCLGSARVSDGGIAVVYTTNVALSPVEDASHYHLHFFTADPDHRGGITPSDAIMQMSAEPNEGSWFNIYSSSVVRLDANTEKGGQQKALDLGRPLLCVRVASGVHALARDRKGGYQTGNCIAIAR